MSNLDVAAARSEYATEHEAGKKVAKENADRAGAKTVAERLEQLASLKVKGLITQEEFDAKKADLRKQLESRRGPIERHRSSRTGVA